MAPARPAQPPTWPRANVMPQLVATGERSAARARAPVVSFHDGALLTNCNGDVAPTLTKINGGHSFAPSPSTVLSAKSTPIDRRALSVAPSATNRDPRAAAKLRLVVIGSGGQSYFIDNYDPTISDSYLKQCYVDENIWRLEVTDTAGQDEFASIREPSLRSGDGFLLVFSLTNRESFEYIKRLQRYLDRLRDKDRFPMIVAGNKCDLQAQRQISREEAECYAQSLQIPYFECSAKLRVNVDQVFHDLIRSVRRFRLHERQNALEQPDAANTSGSSANSKRRKMCSIM